MEVIVAMPQEVPTPVPQMMEELVVMKDILVGRAQHSYWLQEGPTEKTLLMALTITLVAGTLLTAITGLYVSSFPLYFLPFFGGGGE